MELTAKYPSMRRKGWIMGLLPGGYNDDVEKIWNKLKRISPLRVILGLIFMPIIMLLLLYIVCVYLVD